jgi:hypothetical protein
MVCEWAEVNVSDAKEKIVVIQPGNKEILNGSDDGV